MAGPLGLPKKDRDFSRPPDNLPPLASPPAVPGTAPPYEDERYVRMRCLEAAARNPDVRHAGGIAAGVLDQAQKYSDWVLGKPEKAS